jgi:hypothetical protein
MEVIEASHRSERPELVSAYPQCDQSARPQRHPRRSRDGLVVDSAPSRLENPEGVG